MDNDSKIKSILTILVTRIEKQLKLHFQNTSTEVHVCGFILALKRVNQGHNIVELV